MKRVHLHRISALILVLSISSMVHAQTQRPNIVVVLADDHAFEAISCYGTYLKDHARTPAIDRLAKEGMRFDEFVCGNSICSPSRASILTGQYSHRNEVTGLGGAINDDSPQYPVELQKAGYETFLVGKWHLKSKPKGFGKHMVVKGQGRYFDPTFSGSEGTWQRQGYSTDVYTDIALDWLGKRDESKPFLMCLQFKAPHHDYGHAKRYNDLLAGEAIPEPPTLHEDVRNSDSKLKTEFLARSKFHMLYSGSRSKQKGSSGSSYYTRHLKDAAPNQMWKHDATSDKDKIRVAYQHMIHKYIRCATGNDDNLKRILDYLDEAKIAENTVVIYTSDQGYWLGQHGFYDKRLILETSIRMPFVIRYPKLIRPGTVSEDLCANVDIAPTLLELAGVNVPAAMQGLSMAPILRGKAPDEWRSSQFYTYWGAPNHYGVRTRRYTYTKVAASSAGMAVELFDRERDPHQVHNVASDPSYKDVLIDLDKELADRIRSVNIPANRLPAVGGRKK